jgi:hypothetical protein
MRRRSFVPYLGRKSCPLGLSLGPSIVEAPEAAAALMAPPDPNYIPDEAGYDMLGQKSRERPVDEVEITAAMFSAGVSALRRLCPFDFAFPVGGEDDAVEAVLKAAWRAHDPEGSESTQRFLQDDPAR